MTTLPSEVSRGVIYVAMGARFVAEAVLSVASIRKHLSDINIILFTDQAGVTAEGFNSIVHLTAPHPKAHINKLLAMLQSPFDKTLLLDTDTFVCADVSDLFALLDRFDMAMSHDRSYRDDFPRNTGVPDAFIEFNSGVIAFRRCAAVHDSLRSALNWTETLRNNSGVFPRDQKPLRLALFQSATRVVVLPLEYNCRFATYAYLNGTVRILHGRLPNRAMRAKDFERVGRILNKVTVPRVVIVGVVIAMVERSLWGREYWTPTVIGRLYRPHFVLFKRIIAWLWRGCGFTHRMRSMTNRTAANSSGDPK